MREIEAPLTMVTKCEQERESLFQN